MPNPILVFYDPELGNINCSDYKFIGTLPQGWTAEFTSMREFDISAEYSLIVLDDRIQEVQSLPLHTGEIVPVIWHKGSTNHQKHLKSMAQQKCVNTVTLDTFSHGNGPVFRDIAKILCHQDIADVQAFVTLWRQSLSLDLLARLTMLCNCQMLKPAKELEVRIQEGALRLPLDFFIPFDAALRGNGGAPLDWYAGIQILRSLCARLG